MIKSRTTTVEEVVPQTGPQEDTSTKVAIFKSYQIVWYFVGLLEVILLFRFIFKATGAAAGSGFVNFIYSLSSPFMAPFRGIYPTTAVETARVEWVDLVAMAVYLLIGYGLVYFLNLFWPLDKRDVQQSA